jgi:hypothetical protein
MSAPGYCEDEPDEEDELLDELVSCEPVDVPRVPFRRTVHTIAPSISATRNVATNRVRRISRRSCDRMSSLRSFSSQ